MSDLEATGWKPINKKGTIFLGVTGGMGSGKSVVCQILASFGARIYYADSRAKELMREFPALRNALMREFGSEIYEKSSDSENPTYRVNRKYLANMVFNDKFKLQKLNSIVHPYVYEDFELNMQLAEKENIKVLVQEAALIFETGGEKYLDAVLVIDTSKEVKLKRVLNRDELTENEALQRMNKQLDPSILRQKTDYIIENNGNLRALEIKVKTFWERVIKK